MDSYFGEKDDSSGHIFMTSIYFLSIHKIKAQTMEEGTFLSVMNIKAVA